MDNSRKHPKRSLRGTIGALALLAWCVSASGRGMVPTFIPADTAIRCIRFISPTPGAMIVDPVCTVKVETRCEAAAGPIDVSFVLPSPDRSTTEIVPVGRASGPPYAIPWTTTSIPNLLFDGAELQARCLGPDSTVYTGFVKGISIFHGILSAPRLLVPYRNTLILPPAKTFISLTSPDSTVTARASVSWSSDSLFFTVDVIDPHLNLDAPPEVQSRVGVEFLLDPHFSRGAFPTQREFVVAVPVNGSPFRIVYSAQAGAGGSFVITKTTQAVQTGIQCLTGKGEYYVQARIPMSLLRDVRPDSLGFNLIVNYLDSPTSVGEISWVPARGNDVYSPCIWGRLVLGPRVRFEEAAVLFGLAFVAGCGLVILIGFPCARPEARAQRSLRPARYSLGEGQDATNIIADIEAHVTERGLTLRTVSERLSMSPGRALRAIRRVTGRSFADNMLATRIEIAKERLRSSRTSEAFIAESCGFADAQEMNKAFRKFCKTTPEQFRREFHIA